MFKVIPNKENVKIRPVEMATDTLKDLPYIPPDPLPKKNFFMLISGGVGSGKSTLWNRLTHDKGHKIKNKDEKHPRFYWKVFDKCYLFSCSKATLPTISLPEEQIYPDYDAEILQEILDELKDSGENPNSLFIFDDCIRSIMKKNSNNASILHKLILNRRHATHNADNEKASGNSIMLITQKFNLLPLSYRNSLSHLIIFFTNNSAEIKAIYLEYGTGLKWLDFKKLLNFIWGNPKEKNFCMIDATKPLKDMFYKNFDKVEIDEKFFE
tara:strand:+ start:551 stop:1354 length:804 start_codon:yes stop_codon:yes gene_type:complete